jgi:hypothetical protein
VTVHARTSSVTITYGPTAGAQTTITRVLQARTVVGLDIAVSEATFSVPTTTDLHGATYWSIVSITLSAGGGGRLWMGYIVEFDYTLYPREIGVICKGFLVRAQLMQMQDYAAGGGTAGTTLGGKDMTAAGAGAFDNGIVVALLNASGLFDGGANPPHLLIAGAGVLCGTIAGKSFLWAEGQSALDYIAALDAISVNNLSGTWSGYRTYDEAAGTISRGPIVAIPAGTAAWTFTEGVDIFSGDTTQQILDAKNKIIVTGYDAGLGTGAVNYTIAVANSHIPTPPQYITEQINSPLIERQLSADPGNGFACEDVANFQITQWNRTQVKVTFATPRDDTILLSDTIGVSAAGGGVGRLGVAGNFWVKRLECAIDPDGAFTQRITALTGGA